jgi:glucuronosyltransferase
MTHGGLLGANEAAYCGVPVVVTPFYGDQFLNSAALENRGMGVILKYQDINEQSVNSALRRVLDKRFRNQAKKVAYAYKHRPMSPSDSAVFWSEYVIATHGAELVKPHTVYAHWIVYSGLDIFVTVTILILATIAYWIHLLKRVFGSTKKGKNEKVKKSNSSASHASYYHHKAE